MADELIKQSRSCSTNRLVKVKAYTSSSGPHVHILSLVTSSTTEQLPTAAKCPPFESKNEENVQLSFHGLTPPYIRCEVFPDPLLFISHKDMLALV